MVRLREVMSTDLVTVGPTVTVAEAAQVMSIRHVGAALVVQEDELVGIFTERDIMRALAAEHDAASHEVRQWMSKDPVTLGPDATGDEALDLMLERGFRHVPVMAGAHLAGVVSMRDVTAR